MKLFTRIRKAVLYSLLFGAVFSTALASPLNHNGIPVTTSSQQAFDYFVVAQDLLDQGKYVAAHKLFDQALSHDPNFTMAWIGYANSASSSNEFKQGIDTAEIFLPKANEAERLIHRISKTFLSKDLENRVALSKKLVELYPNSPRSWLIRANALGNVNNQVAERKAFSHAIKLDKTYTPAYTQMGFSYIFSEPKNFKKGEKYMMQATQLNPGRDVAHINLGDAHRAIQMLKKASQDYQTAALINPNSAVAFVKKGHVDSFRGDFTAAAAAYKQALNVSDDINRPYYANYKTFIKLHQSQPKVAIQQLTTVIKNIDLMTLSEHQKNSAKLFALTNQVTIALHHNYLDQAKSILDQRDNLMREVSGNLKDKDFTRNQEADIAFWRGQLAARQGDLKMARQFAMENKKWVADNNSPRKMEKYHELEGLVNLLSEKFDQAKIHYTKANQNDIYVKYHLAMVMELSGDKKGAKAIFKEVSEFNFNSVEFALIRREAINRAGI
ncbi:MAG: tetratricopeptide repeat protein [Kangiellaceae bacterium]|nr:tetratricopeptide repeat protein [Kangiellaceae bacterium]